MAQFISGFTYVRNGFTFGYPFIPSIRSLLPLVDELVVVVGDSSDGTREAIADINDPKIKIIDTVWDDNLRQSGKIFALQSNLGLEAIRGDWAFHLQADEVLHEQDYPLIKRMLVQADADPRVDGLLFPFLHFWGDYRHIRNSRRVHHFEIRAFKTQKYIRSYKDSQGFRIYPSPEAYHQGARGTKLKVLFCDAPVYHYSYSRHPYLMKQKDTYFHRFWHDDQWIASLPQEELFDFNQVDRLATFEGTHPATMHDTIAAQNWQFHYDPSRSNMRLKDKIIHKLNDWTGRRWFEYKNYTLIK